MKLNLIYKENEFNEGMSLCIRDNEGYDWYILTVYPDGTLTRHTALPKNVGIQLDDNGLILEIPEEGRSL